MASGEMLGTYIFCFDSNEFPFVLSQGVKRLLVRLQCRLFEASRIMTIFRGKFEEINIFQRWILAV
jgi:hypothetical protein